MGFRSPRGWKHVAHRGGRDVTAGVLETTGAALATAKPLPPLQPNFCDRRNHCWAQRDTSMASIPLLYLRGSAAL